MGRLNPVIFPTILIIAYGFVAIQPELRLAVPSLVGGTAVTVILLATLLHYGKVASINWSPSTILGVALLLRLMFLFYSPQLSDDIYRYFWDGTTLLRGINPYAHAPAAVIPPTELQPVHTLINHPQYATIYPPMAQLIFAGGAVLGTITGFKAVMVLFDLVLCWLLITLLRQLEMPVWRSVLYAWNPLPIIEIAGSGHVDGAGLSLLLGGLCLLMMESKKCTGISLRRWPFFLAGILLTGGGLVKLFPLILSPIVYLLVPKPRRIHFALGLLSALAMLLVSFLPHLPNILVSLKVYAFNWEFAGFAFTTLRTLTGSGYLARIILSVIFLLVVGIIFFQQLNWLQGKSSPVEQGRKTLTACYTITLAFLLSTPTLQPWYALNLAVFLPFCAGPAGLMAARCSTWVTQT